MSSQDRYVEEVHAHFGVRPVFPVGLPLTIGTIGSVEDGRFTHLGTTKSILGVEPGEIVTGPGSFDWSRTSGEDASFNFLAAGEASTLFPSAPHAKARVEVLLERSDSFMASVLMPTISTLADPASLIKTIQEAFYSGAWKREYVLVNQVVVPKSALVLLAQTSGTKLLLQANADVGPASLAEVSAKASVTHQTQEVTRFESRGKLPMFYNAYRVKDSILLGTTSVVPFEVNEMTSEEFFESV